MFSNFSLGMSEIWIIGGPILSTLVLYLVFRKYRHRQTILHIYNSNDVCVFYQFGAHAVGNLVFTVLQIPPLANHASCIVRKWMMVWAHSTIAFCHLPSLLDFGIRTFNIPFYHQFHSRSAYKLLLVMVLCTWVSWFTTNNISHGFPQNDVIPTQCDVMTDERTFIYFFGRLIRACLFAFSIGSQIYMVVVIVRRNKHIRDQVIRSLNQILFVQSAASLLTVVTLGAMSNGKIEVPWKAYEWRFMLQCMASTLIDVLTVILIPPINEKIFRLFKMMIGAIKIWN